MLKEGVEIRNYTLKKFLGRGSFGEVWLAEKEIEIADKKVPFALKFLVGDSQKLSDYSSVKREINTWIDASGHKNVVSVLDGFIHENYFVIVSEYANGGSFRDWLRENNGKPRNLEKTVEIMSGILDGLTHLHAQNIVHRDLKPENVLLKGDDIPCIVDFGVSRVVETASLTNSQLGTNTAGSPLYMSPESFERIKPAPQIDIWSAGVMLFEMLSGKLPYSGDTIPALIFEIVTKEPRSLPQSVPESFQQIVKKSLAKDVSERFNTAKEMRDALMKALYSQDYTPTVSDEEFVSTKKQFNDEQNKIELSETLSLNNQPAKNKKSLAWIGLGLGGILAASVGIFTMTQFSVNSTSNQENSSITNQTSTVNKTSGENVAAESPKIVNAETVTSQDSVKPADVPDKNKQKTSPPIERPAGKTESTPKKGSTKSTPKGNKKVNLDDLLDGRD